MTEREKFEKAVTDLDLDKSASGYYVSVRTDIGWNIWQACAEEKNQEIAELREAIGKIARIALSQGQAIPTKEQTK